MTASNRAALISKIHKTLKKHYQPVSPPSDRPLLEHLLYACCLEDATYDAADQAFARLQQFYYDWNEVRVTTVAELSETMTALPDPPAAASRLKQVLQSVFETHYSFDLEHFKKENIGKAIKTLEKYKGITPFAISYVTQHALGGHSIGMDRAVLDVLLILGVVTDVEIEKNRIPGMERAIPKTKGIEFASLLHQLAADFAKTPFAKPTRAIMLEIAPDAKERFPKRGKRKDSADTEDEAPAAKPATARRRGKSAKSKEESATAASKSASGKKAKTKKKSATKRLARKKPR